MNIQELRKGLPSQKEMTCAEHYAAVTKAIFESFKADVEANREYEYNFLADEEDSVFLIKADVLSGSETCVTGAWDLDTLELAHTKASRQFREWAYLYQLEH